MSLKWSVVCFRDFKEKNEWHDFEIDFPHREEEQRDRRIIICISCVRHEPRHKIVSRRRKTVIHANLRRLIVVSRRNLPVPVPTIKREDEVLKASWTVFCLRSLQVQQRLTLLLTIYKH
jgi:hypothetical protein